MKVLAIDPGFGRCGAAVLAGNASQPELIYSSCVETVPKSPFTERILAVGSAITRLIEEHSPDVIALEELFFTNNAKTALHVAEVRGMLMYIAVSRNIPVIEHNPLAVKIALTGNGRATKEQVMKMVNKTVSLPPKKMLDDEYDAIALGITALAHAAHQRISAL